MHSLLAEIEESDGVDEFRLEFLAGGAARFVDQEEYRFPADLRLSKAIPQILPFVHVAEVIRIVVGRDSDRGSE